MVPKDLRCLSLVRCATNLVADVEVGSRCLLNFFRRSSKTKSYTSTPHCKPKVHKYWLQRFIFATESSYAYRYFRNDGVDLGQRDKEIADYCRRNLEPVGEVPYLIYYPSFVMSDLIGYRHLKVRPLIDRDGEFLPPATVSGTFIVLATAVAPAIWTDYKALRDAQPVDRIGNVLIYRGTYYLPNARADALLDRAQRLFEEPKPELVKIESLLEEGLALRPTDFGGWMMLGNLNLLRGDREQAVVAYRKARDVTPPSPFQQLFEEQIRLVLTQPVNSVTPMRDPGLE